MRLPGLPNPWILLCGLVLVIGLVVGAYIKGGRDAVNAEAARAQRDKDVAQIAYDNAQRATGEAISKIKVENKTIHTAIEKEIIRDPVYRDCLHSDVTFGLLNRHLQGPPGESAGGRELPANTRGPP